MSAQTILVNGRRWKAADSAVIVDTYLATEEIRRVKLLLGCERCKTLCVLGVTDCHCCAVYGTRTAGGSLSHYPEDGRGHRTLMAMSDFVAKMREIGAAS